MILWQPPQAPAVKRRIPVRMIQPIERSTDLTALFEEREWRACVIPQWEYQFSINRLILDGVVMGGSWQLFTYEEGLVTDDIRWT